MKKVLAIIMLLLVIGSIAFLIFRLKGTNWDARVDAAFVNEPCPESADERVFPDGAYTGPLYDTHIHIPAIPDGPLGGEAATWGLGDRLVLGANVTIPSMDCLFATEGTDKVFGFFSVWDELAEPMIDVVARAVAAYPDRFVPFIMPPFHDDSPSGSPTVDAATLERLLAIAPELFDGYGEIGLYARNGGSAELLPDDPRMLAIYPVAAEHNLLVYVHLGYGHQASFERALDLFPDVTFIFHGDQLIAYEPDHHQNLTALDTILSNHPNAYYGIDELYGDVFLLRPEVSKEEFFAHFADQEALLAYDLATWKDFIVRHQDQVLWGTDRGGAAAWSLDTDVGMMLTDYSRTFISRLPKSVQEKFAYKNAELLLKK